MRKQAKHTEYSFPKNIQINILYLYYRCLQKNRTFTEIIDSNIFPVGQNRLNHCVAIHSCKISGDWQRQNSVSVAISIFENDCFIQNLSCYKVPE